MARNHLALLTPGLILLQLLSGCMPSIVRTEHDYVLIRREGDTLAIVEDDDPLYDRFEGQVLSHPSGEGDSYPRLLLMIYEHATEAFLATNVLTSLSQTIANRPMIVVDSSEMGVLRNVVSHHHGERVPVELALGVGNEGEVDLDMARQDFARLMASLLLELMGVNPDPQSPVRRGPVYEMTTPRQAFYTGFEAALDAVYGQQHPELLHELEREARESPEVLDRLYRYELVPSNGLRFRFDGGRPTSEIRSRAEAARTPGVVATFLYRLLRCAGHYYPQRHMLWFANFESEETPYAKVLLAMNHMSGREDVSVQAFIESYIEVFPAEGTSVSLLADQVLGPGATVL